MKRTFLGIPVSKELRLKVSSFQKELSALPAGFKMVEPENLHFTIKFFGEIDGGQIEKVKEILTKTGFGKDFSVRISGLGVFPNTDYLKVLWLGLEGGQRLKELQDRVDVALSGLFPKEKDFVSHLTIARIKFVDEKEKLKQFLEKNKKIEFGEMIIDRIVLYESVLGKDGPVYTELDFWELEK